MRLHEDEVLFDAAMLPRLLAAQAPELAGLPVTPLPGLGTVHHVFRIGDELVARLPRKEDWGGDLRREAAVLRRVAPALPVRVPEPVLLGVPGEGFPLPWAVHRWVAGTPLEPSAVGDVALAEDLAAALLALHAVDPTGLPTAGRRPLADLDAVTLAAIDGITEFDRSELRAAWSAAIRTHEWDGRPATIHADLLPPNLVVDADRLVGLLDWGTAGAGDPAHDLIAAWASLRSAGRARFRELMAPSDEEWARGRGIALHQALLSIPYYRAASPAFAAMNVATVREVLTDPEA